MIMGLSSSGTFCTRAIEAADAMPCQHGWQWHAFLGWACNMAVCRAPWHEGVSCAGEGQHGVVDGRLPLWILWLGGCCQVPASQAAMVVPCVLEAVWGQAALSRHQGCAICGSFLVEIVKNVFQDLKVMRCCPRF